jgi:putative Mn2+ efflux pump MntP
VTLLLWVWGLERQIVPLGKFFACHFIDLFLVAVSIGITASAMTWTAMRIGNRLSQRFAHRMEIIGGLIMIIIALKLLFI